MLQPLFSGRAVNGEEVAEEKRPLPAVVDVKKVFHFVALLAEAPEAHKVLVPALVVEMPDLVAVHPACSPANLAVMVGSLVNRAAKAVPLATRH